jgi:hypothetical protein
MTAIMNTWIMDPMSATGIYNFPLKENFTDYKITVRGSTGQIAVEFMPLGADDYDQFDNADDGLMSENSSAVFTVGPSTSLRITPTDISEQYTVQVICW